MTIDEFLHRHPEYGDPEVEAKGTPALLEQLKADSRRQAFDALQGTDALPRPTTPFADAIAPKPHPPATRCDRWLHEDTLGDTAHQFAPFRCEHTGSHLEHETHIDGARRTWK